MSGDKEKTPRHIVVAMHALYLQGYNTDEIADAFEINGGRRSLNFLFKREGLMTNRSDNLPKLGD